MPFWPLITAAFLHPSIRELCDLEENLQIDAFFFLIETLQVDSVLFFPLSSKTYLFKLFITRAQSETKTKKWKQNKDDTITDSGPWTF